MSLTSEQSTKSHHIRLSSVREFFVNSPNTQPSNKTSPKPSDTMTLTNKKRHILLVTETWYPDINGVSMSLSQLMQCLSEMGHQISLIRPRPKVTSISNNTTTSANKKTEVDNTDHSLLGKPNFIQHDIQVTGVPIPKYSDLQLGMPSYKVIKKQLKNIQPDIIHIATEGPLGLSALIAAKRLNFPVTTGYHTQFHDFSKHFGLGVIASPMMAYFRQLHNWSNATCVPSQKTENDLTKLGFKRLYQVGRGVDMDHYHPNRRNDQLRKNWGVGHQHTVLIMVSRLSPEKGVDLVIKSFRQLQVQQLHRALKLVIVGDGPDKARLESISDNNEDIMFAGMQTGDSLAQYYASADAFVFASQVETFGNVVIEAMASGLPVYAFNDAAAGMLVDNSCGGLVDMEAEETFCQMVADLPKLQHLQTQGQNARVKVSQMSWKRPATQMLAMFEDAINSV